MDEGKSSRSQKQAAEKAFGQAVNTRAPAISCNSCQAALPDAQRLDTKELKGIELAFKAYCSACDQETWAVRGEPAAVRAFYSALEKSAGNAVKLGSVKPATDD